MIRLNTIKLRYCDKENVFKSICRLYIVLLGIFLLIRGFLATEIYSEVDSYALPVISLEYRGSIVMNETDITKARTDFPEIYKDIYSYEDLRVSKLIKADDNNWISFYFPLYSLLCIPIKIVLKILRVSQERCFTLTNIVFVLSALTIVYKKLKASFLIRFLIVLSLSITPIIFYTQYIGAEIMICSFVIIALVYWMNKKYKRAAIFITLAGMPNPTIMVVGIFIIMEYFHFIFSQEQNKNIVLVLKRNIIDIVKFGLCFVPCFIPFIFNYIMIGNANNIISSGSEYMGILSRFKAYFVDINLGFSSFAPVTVFLFWFTILVAILKKKWNALFYAAAAIGTVLAYSVMIHINSGMLYCARYVIWSYPTLVFFTIVMGYQYIKHKKLFIISAFVGILVSAGLIIYNGNYSYVEFNNISKLILHNTPGLYNPYYATFNSRVNHIDGGYQISQPIWYKDPKNSEIKKILLRGEPESKEFILNNLTGSEEDINYLNDKLNNIKNDNKYHYLNIPVYSKIQLREKTVEEKGIVSADMQSIVNLSEPMYISGNDQLEILELNPGIEENTFYKINIKLEASCEESDIKANFVDFYSEEGYDSANQEINGFYEKGKSEYTFFLKTDNIDVNMDSVRVRLVFVSEEPIYIEKFEVVKMNYMKQIYEFENISFTGENKLEVFSSEININSKQNILVKIEISNPGDLLSADTLFMDLYGGSVFDTAEQEREIKRVFQNCYLINTGDITVANEPIKFRIVAVTEKPIIINKVEIFNYLE